MGEFLRRVTALLLAGCLAVTSVSEYRRVGVSVKSSYSFTPIPRYLDSPILMYGEQALAPRLATLRGDLHPAPIATDVDQGAANETPWKDRHDPHSFPAMGFQTFRQLIRRWTERTWTPMTELRSVLDLSGIEASSRVIRHYRQQVAGHLVEIRTIEVPKRQKVSSGTGLPIGLSALRYELGDVEQFDLIYREGRLIAIFPVLYDLLNENLDIQRSLSFWKHYCYFDTSAFEFLPPRPQDRSARKKWWGFALQWETDQSVISELNIHHLNPKTEPSPLRMAKIGKQSGFTRFWKFNPGEILSNETLLRELTEKDPTVHMAIFPVFPTVYAAFGNPHGPVNNNDNYYLHLNRKLRSAYPSPKISRSLYSLVVGPGTGITAWLISLQTLQKIIYAAGLNPFEIANTRVLAHLTGFEVDAKIFDNIVSENGVHAFDRVFDLVEWNMPWYSPNGPERDTMRYTDVWDADHKGKALHRFADNLHRVLRPSERSRVLVWNIPVTVDGNDEVETIFNASGLEVIESNPLEHNAKIYVLKLADPAKAQNVNHAVVSVRSAA